MLRSKFLLATLFILQSLSVLAGKIPDYEINNHLADEGFVHLGTYADIAQDTSAEWRYISVKMGEYDDAFVPIGKPIQNIDFTTGTYWMRSEFINNTQHNEFFLECARPITNEVELYMIDSHGELIKMERSGDEIPFSSRPIRQRRIVFQVHVAPQEQVTFYVKMRSDGEVINAQMKLWTIEAFSAFSQRENQYLGVYYGLLISVLLIFSFIAVVMKQQVYNYYVAYIGSLIFMQSSLDGIAFQNFWPWFPWLANHSVLIFSASSVLLLMLYAAKFLELSSFPKAFRVTYYTVGSIVAICFFTAMTNGLLYEITFPLVNLASLLALLSILGGIAYKALKGFEVNVLFAVAFIAVLNGGILFIAANLGLYFNEFLSDNAIKLGSAFEVIFLSMAMAGRYRQMQAEKEQAQNEAYEHLEAINKITQNQKERLESIVVRRTAEIKKANEQLEEKNKEIIDSINYAKRIQEAILPPNKLFAEKLPNSFITYLPKDIVAGDFYWMETVANPNDPSEEIVLFAAADCTGHGVPGAMVSVVCSNALNRAVREYNLFKPNQILDSITIIVEETFSKNEMDVKDGMDISLCAFYKKSLKLEWAGANNGLYILSENGKKDCCKDKSTESESAPYVYELKPNKQPIGKFANRVPFELHEVQLEKGDCLYSYSDGFADQFGGEKGKKYKSKNFREFLRTIFTQPILDQGFLLKEEFNQWRGDIEQIDDVCIIGVKV